MAFTEVPTNQSVVSVIGGGCSAVTEALASNLQDIPVVSWDQGYCFGHCLAVMSARVLICGSLQTHLALL